MRVVHITWRDATHIGAGEWVTDPDSFDPRCEVVTVGMLVGTRRGYHLVCHSVQEDGSVTGLFAIPDANIRRVRVLAD